MFSSLVTKYFNQSADNVTNLLSADLLTKILGHDLSQGVCTGKRINLLCAALCQWKRQPSGECDAQLPHRAHAHSDISVFSIIPWTKYNNLLPQTTMFILISFRYFFQHKYIWKTLKISNLPNVWLCSTCPVFRNSVWLCLSALAT